MPFTLHAAMVRPQKSGTGNQGLEAGPKRSEKARQINVFSEITPSITSLIIARFRGWF
jgi:hypothetical protein